jgi:hypothetical protein
MKLQIVCSDFKPLRKGTLVGFADIVVRELRLTIHDVSLHQKGDSRWAGLPGKPWVNRDGVAVRDADGKIKYQPVLEMEDAAVRGAFSEAVWRAVAAFAPEDVQSTSAER